MHGLYSIDHNIEYRQIVDVASDWFLDKYNMQDPDMTIKMNLTNSTNLNSISLFIMVVGILVP